MAPPMDYTLTSQIPTTAQLPATYASRTLIVTSTPSEDEQTPSSQRPADGTLRLRGGPIQNRRVTWGEDVIDNEDMGRKKSKVCCIFRRARSFGESSSEESSSDDSSSDSDSDMGHDDRAHPTGNSRGCGDHSHHGPNHSHGRRKSRRGPKRPPSPNAYEKMPKVQRKN